MKETLFQSKHSGYASRYFFKKEDRIVLEEKYDWYFGPMNRTDAKVRYLFWEAFKKVFSSPFKGGGGTKITVFTLFTNYFLTTNIDYEYFS